MTHRSEELPRVLRPEPWLLAPIAGAAIAFVAGTVLTWRQSGWGVVSFGFAAMSVVAFCAIVQTATTRIVLSERAIEFGSLLRRRCCAAADIASVTWESGSGVALKRADGGWIKPPEMGYNAQSLANTLRAWLKRGGKGGKEHE
jgi:hypothetical protein